MSELMPVSTEPEQQEGVNPSLESLQDPNSVNEISELDKEVTEVKELTQNALKGLKLDVNNESMYTVQPGDTLGAIAQNYPGLSYQKIAKYNNIDNPDVIFAGQEIKIPNSESIAKQEISGNDQIKSVLDESITNGMNDALIQGVRDKDMQPVIDYIDNISDSDWAKLNDPKEIAKAKEFMSKFDKLDTSNVTDEISKKFLEALTALVRSFDDNNVSKEEAKGAYVKMGEALQGLFENIDVNDLLDSLSEKSDTIIAKEDAKSIIENYTFDSIVEGEQVKIASVKEQKDGKYTIYIDTPVGDGYRDGLGKMKLQDISLSHLDSDGLVKIKNQLAEKYNSNKLVAKKAKRLQEIAAIPVEKVDFSGAKSKEQRSGTIVGNTINKVFGKKS